MRHAKIVTLLALAGGLTALPGCGLDGPAPSDPGRETAGLTVIEAVQLGAEQGCRDVAGRVSGSIELSPIDGAEDLVLVLEDGYPLCMDTMPNVGEALRLIEASYQGDLVGEDHGPTPISEVETRSIESSAGASGDRETDPNPQPAIEASLSKLTTLTTSSPLPAQPVSGTPPTPPSPRSDD